jgi:ABC-2 type transport system ATP-binding protein
MQYPIPKRYLEYLLHPFRKPNRIFALKEINLEIDKGDRIAFLGPNGAGKTSLLKLVAGLLLPSSGKIAINGLDTLIHHSAVKKAVGLVMNEERSFYWRLSGYENLKFYGALDNLSGDDLEGRIADLISLVGLNEAKDKRVATYSSGMKQKLAIARGLMADPDILILDEPTRTLDPLSAEQQIELIVNRIHADMRKTLLIATHRLDEVSVLCNRVCVIKKGKIVSQNSLDDVITLNGSIAKFYKLCVGEPNHDH